MEQAILSSSSHSFRLNVAGLNTLLDDISEAQTGVEDDNSSLASSRLSAGTGTGSGNGSGSGSTSRTRTSSSDPDDVVGGRRERFLMTYARLFVMGFLLSLAAIAAYVWWHFDRKRQEEVYQQNFETYAKRIIDIFLHRMEYKIEVAKAVATSIVTTTTAMCGNSNTSNNNNNETEASNNNNYYYCGISRFERIMAGPRRLAGATAIWYGPLLSTPEERLEWETFAQENAYYLEHNFTDPINNTELLPYRITEWPVSDGIFKIQDGTAVAAQTNDPEEENAPMAPIWQSSPASRTSNSLPMYDQYAEPMRRTALTSMMHLGMSVFSESQNDGPDNGIVNSFDKVLHVSLYTPIIQKKESSSTTTSTSLIISGALTMDLNWSKILGSTTDGAPAPLSIVLENTLGQTFTLESLDEELVLIHEATAEEEDAKMMVYENQLNLVQSSTYQDFATRVMGMMMMGEDDGTNNDVDVCLYRVRVYPTKAFEDEFLNKQPIYTGLGVGGIVLAVAAVFVMYDWIVEKRQARVVASAKRSNAIVRSLFPAGVRNRLMDGDAEGTKLENLLPKDFLPMQTQKARIQNFLTDGPNTSSSSSRDATSTRNLQESSNQQAQQQQQQQYQRYETPSNILGSEPIADFFPATTILFADLAGFTAWSSSREPSQVFMLLETLYGAMDKAARRLGVFKVETVGDCYVAATGIPDPREDHAVLMVRFARSSLEKIAELTDSLESALGPGTGDLAMRMGIHSGPVTAGVLRGEKSRFQLFGDTMNTAARMESTGMKTRVHMSKETADLLIAAGKEMWLEQRGESVVAKGKGQLVTYWLKENTGRRFSTSGRSSYADSQLQLQQQLLLPDGELNGMAGEESTSEDSYLGDTLSSSSYPMSDAMKAVKADIDDRRRASRSSQTNNNWDSGPYGLQRMDRLVDYNVDVLIGLLKKTVARRSVVNAEDVVRESEQSTHGKIALDEIKEVIEMPKYNAEAAVKMASEATVEIPADVKDELRHYIHRISNSYNMNPFHNFEHASHVALSVNKLMKRIVMPDDVDYRRNSKQREIEKVIAVSKDLHQATLGISSDPVTQFACVFVALIHDAGHTGVPNFVVAKEEPALAAKYRNKSLAEQRSIDIAWGILMEDSYENLRRCLFPSVAELKHFRQLIVNSVMATDIFDKELSSLRKARWQKCFHPEEMAFQAEESKADVFNRKATIVIEHIIQASDVAHTMQHWHVYQKWNERLFKEMYAAYKDGRQDSDPSTGWYKGELWFFDNYVIPLARKLDECGVFGVSSAEYLNYAVENRNEWERKGESIVENLVASVKEGEQLR